MPSTLRQLINMHFNQPTRYCMIAFESSVAWVLHNSFTFCFTWLFILGSISHCAMLLMGYAFTVFNILLFTVIYGYLYINWYRRHNFGPFSLYLFCDSTTIEYHSVAIFIYMIFFLWFYGNRISQCSKVKPRDLLLNLYESLVHTMINTNKEWSYPVYVPKSRYNCRLPNAGLHLYRVYRGYPAKRALPAMLTHGR